MQKHPRLRKHSDRCLLSTILIKTQVSQLQYTSDNKNTGDEAAAEKFKECNRAYEVLSDETKRDIYNTQGIEGVEQYER